MDIIIRNAVIEDCPFLARCVMAAMGLTDLNEPCVDDLRYKTIKELCEMEHSLYCWYYFRVAVDKETGKATGCLLSYDGKRYARARDLSFRYAEEKTGLTLGDSDMETCKGEYYLDSLAVLPEYRGNSIGHLLINDAIRIGAENRHSRFTLIAEKDSSALRNYYRQAGFTEEEEIIFCNHPYIRMVYHLCR